MRDKGKVIVTFDYLGRKYSYDLMEESMISDVIDQDRRDVVADIAFISAVVLDYIKRKNSIANQMDEMCRDNKVVDLIKNSISRVTGKLPDKISQSAVNDNFITIPRYKALKDELRAIEEKIGEIENMKWSLISKKDMLCIIRQ